MGQISTIWNPESNENIYIYVGREGVNYRTGMEIVVLKSLESNGALVIFFEAYGTSSFVISQRVEQILVRKEIF